MKKNLLTTLLMSAVMFTSVALLASCRSGQEQPVTEKARCENCGTEYDTKALADNCDKFYGCPKFNIEENKDKLAYYFMSQFYITYDKTTGEITGCWLSLDDNTSKAFGFKSIESVIPDASLISQLDEIMDDEDFDDWNSYDEDFEEIKALYDNPLNKKYPISYLSLLDEIKEEGYKFFEDKTEVLTLLGNPKVSSTDETPWDIPEEYNNDTVIFLYSTEYLDEFYMFNLTKMKVIEFNFDEENNYYVDCSEDYADEDDYEEFSSLKIASIKDFPDLSTAQEIPNTTGYKMLSFIGDVDEDVEEQVIYITKVEETEDPTLFDSPVYKSTNGKYFLVGLFAK